MTEETQAQGQATAQKSKKKTSSSAKNELASLKNVEKMSEAKVVTYLRQMVEDQSRNEFRIGGLINQLYQNNWHGEYQTVEERIEQEFGIKRRKGQFLAQIYRTLVEVGANWTEVKGIGWSKLRYIVPILTKKNYKGWLKKAKNNTQWGLQELVKEHKKKMASGGEDAVDDGGGDEVPVNAPEGLTFKLYPDAKKDVQKAIKKAMKESESDDSGVALHNICSLYMAGSKKAETVKYLRQIGWDETRKIVETALNIDLQA